MVNIIRYRLAHTLYENFIVLTHYIFYHGIEATSFLSGFVRISGEKLFRIGIRLFHLGVGLFGLGIGFGAGFFSRRLFDLGFGSFFVKYCMFDVWSNSGV